MKHATCERLDRRAYFAANLVISEFLASNDNGLRDDFAKREDWIEIHNAGDAAANLNDYYLTDNAALPTQWRFPVQTLAAGEFIVVFASGRNIATAGSALHTNFKLGADGEYLGLIRASDGLPQSEFAPTFPAQTTDVSYGLFDADDAASPRSYFATPTPGASNVPSAAPPTFSSAGKAFTGTTTITLSDLTPGAQIRYTTDRTLPTATSPLYTGPITLSTTTQIRARAFASGYVQSPVVTQTFVATDSSVSAFDTNLPIVVLDTFGQALNDTTNIGASATLIDTAKDDGRAAMLDAPDFSGRVGLRIRGSTSSTYPKKQYALETWDEAGADKDVSLLGMPKESDWVLYAPYTERTLMQNALAMKWANETGHYASRTRFVEVYLNSDGGTSVNYASDYLGVYLLMEKVKVDDDRVDITKMSPSDNSGAAVTGGYLFKKDRVETTERSFTTAAYGQKFAMVTPDETDVTTQQLDYITGYMNQVETVLNDARRWADPTVGYAAYIDVDSFVDFWIVQEMTRNIDAFWLSTFYSKDRNGKLKMGPVWDFNLGLGAANYNESANSQGYDSDTLAAGLSPYFGRLFQDPNFVQKVADRWQELRRGAFSTASLMGDIDANVRLLSDDSTNYPVGTNPTQPSTNPVVRNFKRWQELGTYVVTGGFFDPQGRWIEDVRLVKNWLTARLDWMDSQFVERPTASQAGGPVPIGTPIVLTPHARASAIDSVLLDVGAPARALVPTSSTSAVNWQSLSFTPTASWLSGTSGVGFDRVTTGTGAVDYTPLIGLNVGSMYNVNSSVYIRIQFTLTQAQLDGLDHLVLKMKYDDGFTAWINGVRVMDANSPENINPAWNTAAASDIGADAEGLVYREFDVSSVKGQLVVGTNVLAIQGMNAARANDDLLIVPQLVSRHYVAQTAGSIYYTTDGSDPRGIGGQPAATAKLYSGAIPIAADTHLRARTLINGQWSGPLDETYVATDVTPPTVCATTFDVDANAILMTFNEPIDAATIAANDLVVRGVNLSPASVSYDAGSRTATFRFAAALPDGDHIADLAAGAIADLSGNPSSVAFATSPFFSFAGDVDRDRDVDFNDLLVLAKNYNQAAKTFTQGNVDYSSGGVVDFSDLLLLAKAYNTVLPTPVATMVEASPPMPTRRRTPAATRVESLA